MKTTSLIFAIGIFLFSPLTTWALNVSQVPSIEQLRSDETYNYPDYYQVKEDPRLQNVNLLVMTHFDSKFPTPSVPYNRKSQFGTWIHDSSDGSCLDTRGRVLVRDSKQTVTYRPNGCSVESGDWDDPYSTRHLTSAADIQIDHFVPLKNAYMTGAFEWDSSKRCLYANYLGNGFHLLAVSSEENQRKSDSTPSNFMPEDKSYSCTYLKQWLEVKTIWTLRITPKEAAAIQTQVTQDGCDPAQFVIPMSFIVSQRQFMQDHAHLCHASADF